MFLIQEAASLMAAIALGLLMVTLPCATTSFGTSLPMSTRCAASRPGQTTSMRMTSISPDFCESSCWNSASCSLESFGTETTFIWLPVFFAHASAPVLQRSNSAPTEPQATETVACAAAERAPRTVPAKTSAAEKRTATRDPTGMGPPQRVRDGCGGRGAYQNPALPAKPGAPVGCTLARCAVSFALGVGHELQRYRDEFRLPRRIPPFASSAAAPRIRLR